MSVTAWCLFWCSFLLPPCWSFQLLVPQTTGSGLHAHKTRMVKDPADGISRKELLKYAGLAGSSLLAGVVGFTTNPAEASASGLLDIPPRFLNNRYFLLRSGESYPDAAGIIQANPIGKLSQDNGLTNEGIAQIERAAEELEEMGVFGGNTCFIWCDISFRAQQTARILADRMGVGFERVVPEFSFLEPRGLGIYEGQNADEVLAQVHKADAEDWFWRPPPNTDGTPHESVGDVFVRVRQLMSKLETQYFGEDIILIAPDSECLSVLQAYALGDDFGAHSKYSLKAGEARPMLVSSKTKVFIQPATIPVSHGRGTGSGVEVAQQDGGPVSI